jgi:hypothetical protein
VTPGIGCAMQAAPHVTVQAAAERGPAAITASALESAGLSDVLPESSYACVGDIIDVSMQDGFLRYGRSQHAAVLHLMHAPRRS